VTTNGEELAKQRFVVLNLVRLGGLVFVMLGIAITNGAFDLPAPIGWVVAIAGLIEFFFLPPMLAKKWRSGHQ
jgi:hypothetical protein